MGSTVLSHFITITLIPMLAADWIVSLPLPPWLIMVLIAISTQVGGSFIDDLLHDTCNPYFLSRRGGNSGTIPIWFTIMIA